MDIVTAGWPADPPTVSTIGIASPVGAPSGICTAIDVLWGTIRPHKDYLLGLRDIVTVDVFLGYRSNSDTAGVEVPSESLEMFTALQIPFGLSISIS